MDIEPFAHIPNSGEFKEYEFGISPSYYWVKVVEDDYSEYCAKFASGERHGHRKVQKLSDEFFLVLSSGRIYLFDARNRSISTVIEEDWAEDIIALPDSKHWICTDGLSLDLYDFENHLWNSGRFSIDGVTLDKAEDRIVRGTYECLHDKPCHFTFHVDERKLQVEWKIPSEMA